MWDAGIVVKGCWCGLMSVRSEIADWSCAGDKQRSFVGSKQWIGAIELGFILDTLLGISCKVITVSSGADMPSKAREIAHHFDTQVSRTANHML